jgi:hypothetical protein
VQAAEPPRRGRPPDAAKQPAVVRHKLLGSRQPKRVSFADPVASPFPPPPRPQPAPLPPAPLPRPPPVPPDITLGRPVRSTKQPTRYPA